MWRHVSGFLGVICTEDWSRKKSKRGKDILSIADAVEEPVEMIRPIYEAVLAAPDADVGQIYEKGYAKGWNSSAKPEK